MVRRCTPPSMLNLTQYWLWRGLYGVRAVAAGAGAAIASGTPYTAKEKGIDLERNNGCRFEAEHAGRENVGCLSLGTCIHKYHVVSLSCWMCQQV